MARINAALLPLLMGVDRGLRALGVPNGVIGALAPELLPDVAPPRRQPTRMWSSVATTAWPHTLLLISAPILTA